MPPTQDPVLKSTEASDREAFDEIKRQRDEANARAETAVGAADTVLKTFEAARALQGKVADPFTVAEMVSPRLAEVDRKDIASHVTSDAFAPQLAAFRGIETPPTPNGETLPAPEGEEEPSGAATEPTGGGFGPTPAGSAGSQPIDGKKMVVVGDDEWRRMIADPVNGKAQIEQAYKENRVVQPARPY